MPTIAKSAQESRVFQLEEATIEDLHNAIQSGLTTCAAVVRHYIDRVRAFNGVSSMLVTEDGAPVRPAQGSVRGQAPIIFPTTTIKASTLLPDLDKYRGSPLEYGRMEVTASDPSVQQQFGMIVGIPNAGQVNALATLNIRGERSVTCRGDFDRHPSLGPLPPAAPPVCEYFRHLPDALEQAAALDARYGRAPDLEAMPMYGVVSRLRTPSILLIYARPAAATRATTSISRRKTTFSSGSFEKKAQSFSPKRLTPNTTAAPAILAATTCRSRCCLRRLVISAAPGAAIRPIRTTRPVPHRSDRAPALRCP